MAIWPLFAGVTIVVSITFVLLARASARAVIAALDAREDPCALDPALADHLASTRVLAGNVVVTHGLLAVILLGTAWYAAVPLEAVGVTPPTVDSISLGVGLGIALAIANAVAARLATRAGLDHDERLRELLAPDTKRGWAGLLLVVLPLVAIAEELLFRGAIIGGLAAGYGFPIWGLAALSSVLFGVGHSLQGPGGIIVTTGLGTVLAGAFVVTGSLAVVVIAHYVVNVLEFVAHEGPTASRLND